MITLGVDISKLKFDVFYTTSDNKSVSKTFINNQEGFVELTKFLPKGQKICIGMEATSNYGDALANYMYNHDAIVYVINPAIIKYYGKSLHYRVKTDKQDAKLIYNFLMVNKDNNLYNWEPLSPNHQTLRALNRCSHNLRDEIVKFNNTYEAELDASVKKIYENILKNLKQEIKAVKKQIRELINNDKVLKANVELLISIPGIAELTAWTLLSELPDLKQFKNAKQLAAYAGLNPAIRRSGSSVNGRSSVSKIGAARLRKALYFPAITALSCNPNICFLKDRLKAKGKNGKVIVVAAMHKLLRIVFAILKKGKAFN